MGSAKDGIVQAVQPGPLELKVGGYLLSISIDPAASGTLEGIEKGRPSITFRRDRVDANGRKLPDGIEIRFGAARPTEELRKLLKEYGFRFSEKQVIWYARENEKSRALADRLAGEDVDIDTTTYLKRWRWAKVKSYTGYIELRNSTEFMVKDGTPAFYNTKNALEASGRGINSLIAKGKLSFKRFWNEVVKQGEDEEPDEPDEPDDEDSGTSEDKDSEEDDHEEEDSTEDLELLELEAKAEIELMQMRVEAARRKTSSGAPPEINLSKLDALRREALRLKGASEPIEHP